MKEVEDKECEICKAIMRKRFSIVYYVGNSYGVHVVHYLSILYPEYVS